jgi:hypothetical protein
MTKIDTQWITPHLAQWSCRENSDFISALQERLLFSFGRH